LSDTTLQTRYKRSLRNKVAGYLNPSNLLATFRIITQCSRPIEFLRRYISMSGGTYPAVYRISTPVGRVPVTAFTPDDILTINEIFFRRDYGSAKRKTVVDFGSNIGISVLYFLTRGEDVFAYCFEPLPQNIERFKQNLAGFESRLELNEVAVAEEDGTVEFGWEPTGRYGGIGKASLGQKMQVPSVNSNAVLARVIGRHGSIDLLKIDIERLEQFITERIPVDTAEKIDEIVIELHFDANPQAQTHDMHWRRPITTLTRKAAIA
jgi:FkbM family methyltransferase